MFPTTRPSRFVCIYPGVVTIRVLEIWMRQLARWNRIGKPLGTKRAFENDNALLGLFAFQN